MEEKLAKIITIIFHPNFIPIYSLLLIFNTDLYFSTTLPFQAKILLFIMLFTASVVIPFILYAFLIKRRVLKSKYMSDKEDRIYPYLINAILFFILYWLLSKVSIPGLYVLLLLGSTLLSIILFFINIKYKISVHTTGMGALTGLFIGLSVRWNVDMIFLICLIIFCSGLVGYARLKLNSHKPSEVYWGFLLGFSVFIFLMLF